MQKGSLFDLYLITDNLQRGGDEEEKKLLTTVEAALEGGLKAVQLREKNLNAYGLLRLAKKLRALTRKFDARLIINERVDIALAAEADGVHLRTTSFSPLEARKLLGAEKLIGVSTHTLEQARDAQKSGADFITLGPVFFTPSKAAYGEPLGLSTFKEITNHIEIPVFALGGVTKENIKEVKQAGAYGAALIREITQSNDAVKTTKYLLAELAATGLRP